MTIVEFGDKVTEAMNKYAEETKNKPIADEMTYMAHLGNLYHRMATEDPDRKKIMERNLASPEVQAASKKGFTS